MLSGARRTSGRAEYEVAEVSRRGARYLFHWRLRSALSRNRSSIRDWATRKFVAARRDSALGRSKSRPMAAALSTPSVPVVGMPRRLASARPSASSMISSASVFELRQQNRGTLTRVDLAQSRVIRTYWSLPHLQPVRLCLDPSYYLRWRAAVCEFGENFPGYNYLAEQTGQHVDGVD